MLANYYHPEEIAIARDNVDFVTQMTLLLRHAHWRKSLDIKLASDIKRTRYVWMRNGERKNKPNTEAYAYTFFSHYYICIELNPRVLSSIRFPLLLVLLIKLD